MALKIGFENCTFPDLIFCDLLLVGENTFPNWARLAAGYSEDELKRICYFTRDTPQDDCPYIWKRFDQANYLTAHSEDSPTFAIFNFMKAGFREQPTDFYLRPLFQAAHDFGHPSLYVLRVSRFSPIGG